MKNLIYWFRNKLAILRLAKELNARDRKLADICRADAEAALALDKEQRERELLSGECHHSELPFRPLHSNAGWYIGRFCENCGPYSRNSGYYDSKDHAQVMLELVMKSGGPLNCGRDGTLHTNGGCEHCPHFD